MKEQEILSPREEFFCSSYTAIGTPTFGFKEKSALAAGFSEKSARNTATALMKRPEINERIAELNAENMSRNNLTVDKVLRDLENERLLALEKSDLSDAIRCSELQGKYLALFKADRPMEVPPPCEHDPEKVEELKKFTELYLNWKYNSLPGERFVIEGRESQQETTLAPQAVGGF